MNMERPRTAALIVSLVLLAPPALSADAKGALDGKSYSVDMNKKGDAKSEKDGLVFKDGTFRSTGCDAYGFTAVAYQTKPGADGATEFTATATSAKEGKMEWKGVAKGDTVEGTAVWTKDGQPAEDYVFKGAIQK